MWAKSVVGEPEMLGSIFSYVIYAHAGHKQYKIFLGIISFEQLPIDGAEMQSFRFDEEICTIGVNFSYCM